MESKRLYRVGGNLIKFAWAVEILAVSIGFLISIVVAYSVYEQLNRNGAEMSAGNLSAIFVAGLPFLLVAVVEASKIPIATAMMYARHFAWRMAFLFGVILLATITFETMLNGFERNFSNLTIAIDEKKNQALRLDDKIANLEQQKIKISTVKLEEVDKNYSRGVSSANRYFSDNVASQRKNLEKRLSEIDVGYKDEIDREIANLQEKEREVYAAWDKERDALQSRIRNMLNTNLQSSSADKDKLTRELADLKTEMKREMADASFLTRQAVEDKYRALIDKKEKRLYEVSSFSSGSKALDQQTGTEQMLQKQLKVMGANYQKRVDTIRHRIDYLTQRIKERSEEDEELRAKYRRQYQQFTNQAARTKDSIIQRAIKEKRSQLAEYDAIQSQVKDFDAQIYELNQQKLDIDHEINTLITQNQVYRVAAYVTGSESARDVPKYIVGIVALVWFSSLAFICSVTGVFLAISGIYLQRTYGPMGSRPDIEPETPSVTEYQKTHTDDMTEKDAQKVMRDA